MVDPDQSELQPENDFRSTKKSTSTSKFSKFRKDYCDVKKRGVLTPIEENVQPNLFCEKMCCISIIMESDNVAFPISADSLSQDSDEVPDLDYGRANVKELPDHPDYIQYDSLPDRKRGVLYVEEEVKYLDTDPYNLFQPPTFTGSEKLLIEDFWTLELLGILDSLQPDDEQAIQSLEETIRYTGVRYQVGWPWRESPWKLPKNYMPALGRLRGVLRRLLDPANKHLCVAYQDIITMQRERGIIEPVPEEEIETKVVPVTYIPHHFVLNDTSKTTPVRIVFDGSFHRPGQPSLNQLLHR